MRLSVSMIVRLEEACLATCLESVRGADELVVVDTRLPTDPVDRTREIAEGFGAAVYDFPWIDDFAAARNYSLSKCTAEWVLCIDADETLEPGGIEKIRAAIETAGDWLTIYTQVTSEWGETFPAPRVFKRHPDVHWEREAHNYVVPVEIPQRNHPTDIQIKYGWSKSHLNDPDRTLRILTKMIEKRPETSRERYFLAQEYWLRRNYPMAATGFEECLKRSTWAIEMADAWLMLARCKWAMAKNVADKDEARNACLQAIKINADFKEALLFMADTSGPKNRERWKTFAELATSEDVFFRREPRPKQSTYYDKVFSESKDMSRYEHLLRTAASWTWGNVLDVCCGTGELGKYLVDYQGIDFSEEAVRDRPRLRQGDVFTEDLSGYDTYVILEALEHLNDRALIQRIPAGSDVVFSVPNFNDAAHLRTYNERILHFRFDDLLNITRVLRFNWDGQMWNANHTETDSYILLVRARKNPL